MGSLRTLFRRDDDDEMDPKMLNYIIALLTLILVCISLAGVLLVLRRRRRLQRLSELPMYNEQSTNPANNHRRLTITATPYSNYVIDEKQNLVKNSASPPTSPVPEIRITFPDEEEPSGKRKSGRVVVVRIGEKGAIGLEPCREELPPYQSNPADRFQSLDLDRQEKEDLKRYS
ncbi:hypothetical protein FQN57_006632 [Myotisia sp. PD_48]|nr:hypothetical protein FQN57_006632 [Myotisia sp. PD_48]